MYNIFLVFFFSILGCASAGCTFVIPIYVLNMENDFIADNYTPDYYKMTLLGVAEGIDELMDSWSDAAGADETCDSSSSLTFGSVYLGAWAQATLSFLPLYANPSADCNNIFVSIEDCIFGSLVSLVPLIGVRAYADIFHRDVPCIFIPILVQIEILGQTARALSLTLRISLNAVATHNLIAMGTTFVFNATAYGIASLGSQLLGCCLVLLLTSLLCFEFMIANIQSYVIIVLEAYYELDSE